MLVRAMARRLSSTGRLSCFTRNFVDTKQAKKHVLSRTVSTTTTTTIDDNDSLLVVGSGVAGCATALVAAITHSTKVKLLYAGSNAKDNNSFWAQGGIIYKSGKAGDAVDLAKDIRVAGAGHCNPNAVQKVAMSGPQVVEQLLLNPEFAVVPFDRNAEGELQLCLEASHSAPRIIHSADCTGKEITRALVQAVAHHPNIELVPHTLVSDLIVRDETCVGVETFDFHTHKSSTTFTNRGVVLASGGLGGIYKYTSNPSGFNALGSSVAIASRAHVETSDLEFVQFHPTCLNVGEERFLLTEALRGEGAVLRNSNGVRFCQEYHPCAELAPRDVVARSVYLQDNQVFLDITHRSADFLNARFPTIQAKLEKYGLDLTKDWLPITPAAHYTCGGVATDLNGATSLEGLYAAGEAACTGLHGGNRLASTSLLEGLVFGKAVADHVASEEGLEHCRKASHALIGLDDNDQDKYTPTSAKKHHNDMAIHLLQQVRECMWENVGVVRSAGNMSKALDELEEDLLPHAEQLYGKSKSMETIAIRDAAQAALQVTKAALSNPTSLGAHCVEEDDSEEEEEERAMAGVGP